MAEPQSGVTTSLLDKDVADEYALIDSTFPSLTPSAPKDFALAVSHLSKVFPTATGQKQVFSDISFGVRTHDIFGLLGPNGAGKTTLINILSGSLVANRGDFKVFGYEARRRSELRCLLSVVPQSDVYFEELNVYQHLLLISRLHGVPRSHQQMLVKQVATQIGLERDSLFMLASILSGGQKRRLSLGMAMISTPKIVFLDEPTVRMMQSGEGRLGWIQ